MCRVAPGVDGVRDRTAFKNEAEWLLGRKGARVLQLLWVREDGESWTDMCDCNYIAGLCCIHSGCDYNSLVTLKRRLSIRKSLGRNGRNYRLFYSPDIHIHGPLKH